MGVCNEYLCLFYFGSNIHHINCSFRQIRLSSSESWYKIAQARTIAKQKGMNGVSYFSSMRTLVVFEHKGK